ncbi:MAG TPA: 3-deoxy-manno-octulosonate cytidylyltransferase [Chitinophagaceae bacterium]|nr:3-deoxy-manno-octulosonate cytidylyltransferase [Chitinophagaceae bacterium]
MKKIAVIPARYAATRFPAKLMQMLGEKTVIRHTYENTAATGLFDDVLVVTDSPVIFDEIVSHGGTAVMSRREHESGSDRIAEAVEALDVDVIINVQGDEPFMEKQPLEDLLKAFDDDAVQVASLMHTIDEEEQINNPNIVKVVTDKQGFALLFSRSPIPYKRNPEAFFRYFRHIGVYGYRKNALLQFVKWPVSDLENIEKLEQLRYLENGIRIKMVTTPFGAIGIDTPEDLSAAKKRLGLH